MQEVPRRHETTFQRPRRLYEFSRRYQALLHTADPGSVQALPTLLQELSKLLHAVFKFNFVVYALHDPGADGMQQYVLTDVFEDPKYPAEIAVEGSPAGWVFSNQLPVVLPDLTNEERFPLAIEPYTCVGMRSLILLPMGGKRRQVGVIGFGRTEPAQYDTNTIHFLEQIAGLAGLAISNLLTRQAVTGEEEQLRSLTALSIQLSERSIRARHELQEERARLETVLEINSALAATKLDAKQMFPAVSKSLSRAVPHDAAIVTLWSEDQQSSVVFAEDSGTELEFARTGMVLSAETSLTPGILKKHPEGTVVRRAEMEAAAPRLESVRRALAAGFVCWCVVPMRTASKLIGVLYLGSRSDDTFPDKDLDLVRQVASSLGLFIDNAHTHETLQREKERLQRLFEISRGLTPTVDSKKLLAQIAECVRSVFKHDCAHLSLYDKAAGLMRVAPLDPAFANDFITTEPIAAVAECPSGIAMREGKVRLFTHSELGEIGSEFTNGILGAGVRTVCCIPLITRSGALGAISVASKKDDAFSAADIELMAQIAPQVAGALETSRAYAEVASLKDRLVKEKVYLEQEIREVLHFEEIVGQSPALTHVLEQVKTVAPSDATVLILGETGTGKELIARAIHRLSSRAGSNFVKVNCAAIPTGLLESELFGHEKGAFTGAISQKVGRLELADKGTLLLDEVGEIPLELQPKLLRALQDHEFERLGGTRTIRVDVRIVAATNRDLSDAVTKRQFRSDLYYRLHVFPLHLPPLRERRDDIRLLARYFVQKFARRMNKQIEAIPEDAMHALEQWHWPGNIRELENFLERSVILTDGPVLRIPNGELWPRNIASTHGESHRVAGSGSLEELEREYIVQMLQQTGGVISGSHGAAARLGMKRTTLQSKMARLGITRDAFDG